MDNYKQLLETLEEYKKTKFWETISGDDIFKVDDVYVAILGNAGSALGMAIYENEEELQSQIDITFGSYRHSPDNCCRPTWFEVCIDDSGTLITKDAKKELKKNNIKSKHYICKLEAGKIPRLITEKEAEALTQIIKKIILIAQYFKQNKLPLPKNVDLETMYSFTVEGNKVTHKKIKYPTFKKTYNFKLNIDQEQLNKLYFISSRSGTLEIALLYSPVYINEKTEKYYPYMLIVYDAKHQQIKVAELIKACDLAEVPNKIIEVFQETKQIPKRITVNDELTKYLVQSITKELNIKIFINENLSDTFDVWKQFEQMVRAKW